MSSGSIHPALLSGLPSVAVDEVAATLKGAIRLLDPGARVEIGHPLVLPAMPIEVTTTRTLIYEVRKDVFHMAPQAGESVIEMLVDAALGMSEIVDRHANEMPTEPRNEAAGAASQPSETPKSDPG